MNDPNRRGVSVITLGTVELTLKPTFPALEAIETALKEDLLTTLQNAARGKFTFGSMATCLHELQKAGGGKLTRAQCGDLIVEAGLANAAKHIMANLAAAITAGQGEGVSDPS